MADLLRLARARAAPVHSLVALLAVEVGMASRIWEPVEALAGKLIRFGQLAVMAHVHNGKIHKIEVNLGGSKLTWTLDDVENGKVVLSLIE